MTKEPHVFGMKIVSTEKVTLYIESKILSKARKIIGTKDRKLENVMSTIIEKELEQLMEKTEQ